MLRISRMTDYGTLILVHLAGQRDRLCTASAVSSATHVPAPTVQKLLMRLSKAGLVNSTRGAEGGYQLARSPEQITAAEIVDTLEGPVAITECSADDSQCELESLCVVGSAWQRINTAIRGALAEVTLAELSKPVAQASHAERRSAANTQQENIS